MTGPLYQVRPSPILPYMKTPEQCNSLAEVRAEIDELDQQVIRLLGERFGYVKAASKFKTSEATVRAPERFKAMLEQRRAWALQAGLHPDVIEKMYRDLVSYFIQQELEHWQNQ